MNDPEFVAIGHNGRFNFSCNPEVSCFNACCRNLYQVLTPYDILRLKNYLGISAGEFLERYTQSGTGPETGLPVISLRPEAVKDRACPFVAASGCEVYPARPGSCRMYPLARAVTRCRETGLKTDHYALIKESHCCGFEHGDGQSLNQWLSGQLLVKYNHMNDLFLEVISLKNKLKPGSLDGATRQAFHLAMYNLDQFRAYLKKAGQSHRIPKVSSKVIDNDIDKDVDLLTFGYQWIAGIFRGEEVWWPWNNNKNPG